MSIKLIVVESEETNEVVEGNFPCIYDNGYYVIPYDVDFIDILNDHLVPFVVRGLKDIY